MWARLLALDSNSSPPVGCIWICHEHPGIRVRLFGLSLCRGITSRWWAGGQAKMSRDGGVGVEVCWTSRPTCRRKVNRNPPPPPKPRRSCPRCSAFSDNSVKFLRRQHMDTLAPRSDSPALPSSVLGVSHPQQHRNGNPTFPTPLQCQPRAVHMPKNFRALYFPMVDRPAKEPSPLRGPGQSMPETAGVGTGAWRAWLRGSHPHLLHFARDEQQCISPIREPTEPASQPPDTSVEMSKDQRILLTTTFLSDEVELDRPERTSLDHRGCPGIRADANCTEALAAVPYYLVFIFCSPTPGKSVVNDTTHYQRH